MKKFVLVMLAALAMPLFAEGMDRDNVFIDVDDRDGKFSCFTLDKAQWPMPESDKEKVASLVVAYMPLDNTMYMLVFAHESAALEFVSNYVGIANLSRQVGYALASNGISNLICEFASKRSDKIVMNGMVVAWAWTKDYLGY